MRVSYVSGLFVATAFCFSFAHSLDYGEKCDAAADTCNTAAFLLCQGHADETICNCMPGLGLIHDVTDAESPKCAIAVGSKCHPEADSANEPICVSNSVCHEIDPLTKLSTCACKNGFKRDPIKRNCVPNLASNGETCATADVPETPACRSDQLLQCSDGKCTCRAGLEGDFDEVGSKCALFVGATCDVQGGGPESCPSNSACIESDPVTKEKKCFCNHGYRQDRYSFCERNIALEGEDCGATGEAETAECKPGSLLVCETGKCRCPKFHYYNSVTQTCNKMTGQRCDPEIEGSCSENASCLPNRPGNPIHYCKCNHGYLTNVTSGECIRSIASEGETCGTSGTAETPECLPSSSLACESGKCVCPTGSDSKFDATKNQCIYNIGAKCTKDAENEPSCPANSQCIGDAAEARCRCSYGYKPDVARQCSESIALSGEACENEGTPESPICTENAVCTKNVCSCADGWLEGSDKTCGFFNPKPSPVGSPCVPKPTKPEDLACLSENSVCVNNICVCAEGWSENAQKVCTVPKPKEASIGQDCTLKPEKPSDAVCNRGNAECVNEICECKAGYMAISGLCRAVEEAEIGEVCSEKPTMPGQKFCSIANATCLNGVCECYPEFSPSEDNKQCNSAMYLTIPVALILLQQIALFFSFNK